MITKEIMQDNFKKGNTITVKIDKYRNFIKSRFDVKYPTGKDLNENIFYIFPDMSAGIVSSSEKNACIWIEYADDIKTARKGLYPWDGDGYLIRDYSPETLLEALINEIEN